MTQKNPSKLSTQKQPQRRLGSRAIGTTDACLRRHFDPRRVMRHLPLLIGGIGLALLVILPLVNPAFAQTVTFDMGDATMEEGGFANRVISMVALITVLSLAPSILIMMTSFTRIVVVMSFLRQAVGTQQSPPNMVVVSLAMFLTLFVMMPTFQAAYDQGIGPLVNEEIEPMEAFSRTAVPFKKFMLTHAREKDLSLFAGLNQTEAVENPEDLPLHVVIPSFMISELRRAFEIGFLLFLPFLIIDMVTASILMSMGMMMLPPIMISLPFKIIFFVMVDGWYLISGSLVQSFGVPMADAVTGGVVG